MAKDAAWLTEAWLDDVDGYVLIRVESTTPDIDRPEGLFILAARRKLYSALVSWGIHPRTAKKKSTKADFEEWDYAVDWATGNHFVRIYRTNEPYPELLEDPDEQAGRELEAIAAG